MLFDKYKNKQDRYIYENITFRTISLALVVLLAFETWVIIRGVDSERVVFMPPKVITQEFWVSGNEVSRSYLDQMGQFISFNLFNIDKNNAANNIENILTLVEPNYYYDIKAALQKQVEYIIKNGISRTFFVSAVEVKEQGKLQIHGVIKDIISDKVIKSDQETLIVDYSIQQGRFWITDLNLKEKK